MFIPSKEETGAHVLHVVKKAPAEASVLATTIPEPPAPRTPQPAGADALALPPPPPPVFAVPLTAG
jgi:hypothetical protein